MLALQADRPGSGINDTVNPAVTSPYPPDWSDLVRLHRLIVERRATTILEFGVGKSTVIMAHALAVNRRRHGEFVAKNLRRHNCFELHAIDDMPQYVDETRRLLPVDLAAACTLHVSAVSMGTFNGRICSYYDRLPNICPDFVYLDGPSQMNAQGDVRGVSVNHPDRVPMAADLLAIEHFLLPGTMVVIDGRTANARFIRANLQRGWRYSHDEEADVHLFELCERPLGPHNLAQIQFCLGQSWLDRL